MTFDEEFGICLDPCEHPSMSGTLVPDIWRCDGCGVLLRHDTESGRDVPVTEAWELLPGAHKTPSRADREGDSQPLPTVHDGPCIQDQVIADIEARKQVGISRYGTALQPHNGRSALLDAYEECLDLACYLKQRLVEEGS